MIAREKELIKIIEQWSPYITPLFDLAQPNFKEYWIGAGVITQTIWNYQFGYPPAHGIGDADLLYFDHSGTIEEEQVIEKRLRDACTGLPFTLDVTNEALVHLWYEKKFKKPMTPYQSVQDAIDTWPTSASAIGMKRRGDGSYEIYAPFGLDDLFDGILRPNKRLIPEEVYWNKVEKWKKRWPELTVLPWS